MQWPYLVPFKNVSLLVKSKMVTSFEFYCDTIFYFLNYILQLIMGMVSVKIRPCGSTLTFLCSLSIKFSLCCTLLLSLSLSLSVFSTSLHSLLYQQCHYLSSLFPYCIQKAMTFACFSCNVRPKKTNF